MSYRTKAGLNLLMADDSEDDVFFVQRTLEQSEVISFFCAVPDGREAVAYLQGAGRFSDRQKYPFPNVLLCDLKMPRMDGFDVLRWLRDHPDCRVIPTIIFSSSADEKDIHNAYALGTNAYMEKPTSPDELKGMIRALYEFWAVCQVPPAPPGERCGAEHSAAR